MSFPPEIYLIGAQKSGTTFLSFLLDQSPDVSLSEPKEPDFFTKNFSKGLSWYRSRFGVTDSGILIDASTSYTAAHLDMKSERSLVSPLNGVPERIYQCAPDARFIYILRDPVERTYSSYWHDVRQGNENRPFMEAISEDSSYLRISYYAGQIRQYLQYFPLERFFIVFFEELKVRPVHIAQECFRFMGVEDDIKLVLERGRNQSFVYRGSIHAINRVLNPIGGLGSVVKRVRPFMPQGVIDYTGRVLTKKVPQMSPDQREWLARYFEDKNKELEELLGRDITFWQGR